jgi:hypothetical protein
MQDTIHGHSVHFGAIFCNRLKIERFTWQSKRYTIWVVLVCAIKAYVVMEVKLHSFEKRQGIRRIFSFVPFSLFPLVSTSLYCLNRRQCEPQKRSSHFSEELKHLLLPGNDPRFLRRPARSLVTIVTELPSILYFPAVYPFCTFRYTSIVKPTWYNFYSIY